MRLRRRLHQGQPQPRPRRPPAPVQPHEPLQHRIPLRRRHARPLVGHHQHGPCRQRHADRSRPVRQRVVQQVRQHSPEQCRITVHHQARHDVDRERPPRLLRHRRIGFGHRGHQRRQVELLSRPRPGLRPRDPEQGRKRLEHGVQLGDRHHQGRVVAPADKRLLQPLPQPLQRAAQIVGDVVRHLALRRHQRLQLGQHRVDRHHQPVELVAPPRLRQPARQVARRQQAGHVRHRRQPPLQRPRAHEAEQQRHAPGPEGRDQRRPGQRPRGIFRSREWRRDQEIDPTRQQRAQRPQRWLAGRAQRGIPLQGGRRPVHAARQRLPIRGLHQHQQQRIPPRRHPGRVQQRLRPDGLVVPDQPLRLPGQHQVQFLAQGRLGAKPAPSGPDQGQQQGRRRDAQRRPQREAANQAAQPVKPPLRCVGVTHRGCSRHPARCGSAPAHPAPPACGAGG